MRRRTNCRVFPMILGASLVLGLRSAGPAAAFVLSLVQSPTTGNWYPVRWPDGTQKIGFVVNDTPLELLPNLTSDSIPEKAIADAMRAWSFAPVGMEVEGQVSETDGVKDGVNLITFADTPTNRDLVGDFRAITFTWYGRRPLTQPYWPVQETDVIVNPATAFAMDGSEDRVDLQSVLTHELGHALGLKHSPITGATMYAYSTEGQTHPRVLSPDDVAGALSLYGVPDGPDVGIITGKVLADDEPVLGAHVVATDANGIVQVGGMTDENGRYSLPWLPPGDYQIYAEPLDGPMVPEKLGGQYYDDARTDFRTTFAGGPSERFPVTAGRATRPDPIHVGTEPPRLNLLYLSRSANGRSFPSSYKTPLQITAGASDYLVVVGEGIDAATAFSVSGPDVILDSRRVRRGTTTANHPFVILPISVRAEALPGARNLFLATADETAAFTGGIKVVAP